MILSRETWKFFLPKSQKFLKQVNQAQRKKAMETGFLPVSRRCIAFSDGPPTLNRTVITLLINSPSSRRISLDRQREKGSRKKSRWLRVAGTIDENRDGFSKAPFFTGKDRSERKAVDLAFYIYSCKRVRSSRDDSRPIERLRGFVARLDDPRDQRSMRRVMFASVAQTGVVRMERLRRFTHSGDRW